MAGTASTGMICVILEILVACVTDTLRTIKMEVIYSHSLSVAWVIKCYLAIMQIMVNQYL